MNYLITESQLKVIVNEQQLKVILNEQPDSKMPFQIEKFGYKQGDPSTMAPALKAQQQALNDLKNIDPHTVNTLLAIGTAFIPFVGPFISAGIGLYDAKMYYDEGDTKTAGLVGLFACIPGIGGLASKLGLAKWTSKALGYVSMNWARRHCAPARISPAATGGTTDGKPAEVAQGRRTERP